MTSPTNDSRCRPFFGAIADDVTGATDLAIHLVQGGMCVVQILGVPTSEKLSQIEADAVVVALKTRSIPKDQAVEQSLASLAALRQASVKRLMFKYCSTFDSTREGNIGPVAEALMDALEVRQTIFCPALPRNGRTVYQGHLFVNGCLLNECGMERHPLTPMTDANLVRLLTQQASKRVGLLPYEAFISNSSIAERIQSLTEEGSELIITDACDDRHLEQLAEAVVDMPLVTGGSGIAGFLPDAYRRAGLLSADRFEPTLPTAEGRSLILAGSCSAATNRQVAWMKSKCPSWQIDVPAIVADATSTRAEVTAWAATVPPEEPLLISSTDSPEEVARVQQRVGTETAANAVEDFLATLATELVYQQGVRRLIVAGGETAGAVVQRLGIRSLRIGPEICAGVPWTESNGPMPLALALKSGNFGSDDFFETALDLLP